MNRKIVLIVMGSLLIVCLCLIAAGLAATGGVSWLLFQRVDDAQANVTAVSDTIADYTLPAGFGDGDAVSIAGFSMVSYTDVDGRSHIYLIQAPPNLVLDQADLERQMRQAAGTSEWTETTVIDYQPSYIRGEEATLVISEGVSHDDQRYRSASGLFEGKEGLALVNISAPASSWDQEMVDAFIESLR